MVSSVSVVVVVLVCCLGFILLTLLFEFATEFAVVVFGMTSCLCNFDC